MPSLPRAAPCCIRVQSPQIASRRIPVARPRKPVNVTPGQATYVLEKLRKAGHVTAAQIKGYLADMGREIVHLELRLKHLRESTESAATRPREGARELPTPFPKPAAAHPSRRKRTAATPTRVPAASTVQETATDKVVAERKKRKFTVTPKVLASREVQGRYLPLLNKFSGKRKAAFAKTAKEKGREAAIEDMERALRA
jgi:hypothetical protein